MLLFIGRNSYRCQRILRFNTTTQSLRMKSSQMDLTGKPSLNDSIRFEQIDNMKKLDEKNEKVVISSVDLDLSKDESRLFDMLCRFVKDESLGTTIRVAGGWVRDKLLDACAKEDIDIALDNITGLYVCIFVLTYVYLYIYTCMCIGMYVCIYAYVCTYIHVCMYVFVC
jgi:hypothetical protein